MKIFGATVGTTMPRSNLQQTDPKKADYVHGKDTFLNAAVFKALNDAKESGEFQGDRGKDGNHGSDGKSAYEYAKEGGYPGTEAEFALLLGNIGHGSGTAAVETILPAGRLLGDVDLDGMVTPADAMLVSQYANGGATSFTKTIPAGKLLGDVNGDGTVKSDDADLIARYDGRFITADDLDLTVADVNGDGVVNSIDAMLVAQYTAGTLDNIYGIGEDANWKTDESGNCYCDIAVDGLTTGSEVTVEGIETMDIQSMDGLVRIFVAAAPVADVQCTIRYSNIIDVDLDLTVADVNNDGKVNTMDADLLLRHLEGQQTGYAIGEDSNWKWDEENQYYYCDISVPGADAENAAAITLSEGVDSSFIESVICLGDAVRVCVSSVPVEDVACTISYVTKSENGSSGVHVGPDTPPENANVWVIPEGRPTTTEDWEFDLETGVTDTKTVVVVDSDEATANGELGILRVRQADGSWKEIPAIVGERGADGYTPVKGVDYFDGQDGQDGKDGYTPQKNVDYFDGKDGYTPVKGVDYFDGEKGDTGESGVVTPVSGFYTLSVDADGNLWVTSEDGNTPNFEYDSATGNLYVIADGTNVLIGNVKGIQGERGADGVSATHSWNGTTLTITSASGTSSADLKGEKGDSIKGDKGDPGYTPVKGKDYFDGAAGYTPQKGVDYFDGAPGAPGSNGVSATHSWNGTTLTITSASGTSSADLKGEKGDKGDTGVVDYSRLNDYAKKTEVPSNKETWTFTLEDGSTVTKSIYVG